MYLKIILIYYVLINIISCDIDIESFSFLTSCNDDKGLNYDYKSPIQILNNEFQWKNLNKTSNKKNDCKLLININKSSESSLQVAYPFFLIKIDFNEKTKCDSATYLTISTPSSSSSSKSNNLLYMTNLCDLLKTKNFILVNLTSSVNLTEFQINLTETISNDSNTNSTYQFKTIDSIIITSFRYANQITNECESDKEFKCLNPSNICLDLKYRCDLYESCPDSSDQINCTSLQTTKTSSVFTTTTSFTTSTASKSTSSESSKISTINFVTTVTNDQDFKSNSSLNFFIGILVVLVVLTGILTGIWLYGRRKRRWRELLAQLDNNTDWEYEQLEDAPSVISSRTIISPSFNRNLSSEDRETNLSTINTNNNTNRSYNTRINERSPINFN